MLRHLTFHRTVFWLHLITGVVAGLLILSMAVSGLTIAFERQITEWVDHGFYVSPPADGSAKLPLDELMAKVRETQPDLAPGGITWKADPEAPVLLNLGREKLLYLNPYTGAILGEGDKKWRAFFHMMTDWHRFLGQHDKTRPIGKAITGAGTLLFGGLLLSGIYLWWPRHWRAANLRAAFLFNGKLRGRARDWNWHNVIGFWTSFPMLLIILTGLIMSYAWANNLLFTLTGNEPPPARERPMGGGPGRPNPVPTEGLAALAARAEQEVTSWQTISLRMQGPNAAFMIDASHRGRPDLRTMLTLNPRTAEVVSREPFSSYNLGRQLRTWARWLHTGEAGGIWGQILAALCSAAAILLVWTGFALAVRRFFGKRQA
ncbi:MAG TPA: PepSY-associated TM helix domain-containing protein [Prosthecobacter sp.]|nr:PepSY-associated TM helix domain-containing protein [Prosthecobacter sp.]